MKNTRLARCLLALGCLGATVSPASAGPDPGSRAQLQRQANEAAARYHQAQNDQARLDQEATALAAQIAALEERLVPLRQAATKGAASLYTRDPLADSGWAAGDAAAALHSARQRKLLRNVNDMAGAAVHQLNEATRRLQADRQALEARRVGQERTIAQLAAERREVGRRLAAIVRADRERQARELAAARAERRAREVAAAVEPRPVVTPGSFVCPINGPVAFSNDFGGRRNHKGNDLMSPRGTENVAVVSGRISTRPWRGGGLTIFLHGDDGHTYLYMHLLRFVGPLPRQVTQGEVIGLTGMTGNATAYHTHFEFHPHGGAAANPYPLIAAHC